MRRSADVTLAAVRAAGTREDGGQKEQAETLLARINRDDARIIYYPAAGFDTNSLIDAFYI